MNLFLLYKDIKIYDERHYKGQDVNFSIPIFSKLSNKIETMLLTLSDNFFNHHFKYKEDNLIIALYVHHTTHYLFRKLLLFVHLIKKLIITFPSLFWMKNLVMVCQNLTIMVLSNLFQIIQ